MELKIFSQTGGPSGQNDYPDEPERITILELPSLDWTVRLFPFTAVIWPETKPALLFWPVAPPRTETWWPLHLAAD